MTKSDLIYHVANSAPCTPKQVSMILTKVLDTITRELANGERVVLTGFGTFEVKERGEREVKNPRTGEPVIVPAHKAPIFRPGTVLKEAVKC